LYDLMYMLVDVISFVARHLLDCQGGTELLAGGRRAPQGRR
jgi:hypothetical protein